MHGNKVRLGRISYINASPVYYGLDHGKTPDWLTLVTDVPAALNRKIRTGEVDISPISAAYYAMNAKDLLLVPDFSISCCGKVLSVICASNFRLDELDGKRVLFSTESATGACLLRMIFAAKRIRPCLTVGETHDIHRIPRDVDAVMVIGDAALTQPWESRFALRIDLGQTWFEMTGLAFVFAVWVVRRSFARKYPDRVRETICILRASREKGIEHMDEVVDKGSRTLGLSRSRVAAYYRLLYCNLDDSMTKGMKRFFDQLFAHKILPEPVTVEFFQ